MLKSVALQHRCNKMQQKCNVEIDIELDIYFACIDIYYIFIYKQRCIDTVYLNIQDTIYGCIDNSMTVTIVNYIIIYILLKIFYRKL